MYITLEYVRCCLETLIDVKNLLAATITAKKKGFILLKDKDHACFNMSIKY